VGNDFVGRPGANRAADFIQSFQVERKMEISNNSGGAPRGLADVVREIAARQRIHGFPGRTTDEVQAERDLQLADDLERDQELDAARQNSHRSVD
jgi:hypothetical protein